MIRKQGTRHLPVLFGKRASSLTAFVIFVIVVYLLGFSIPILSIYLIFCTILFLICTFRPSERLAGIFFKIIYLSFIATIIAVFITDYFISV